ncbi:MAG: serine/threonine protein kinase [Lachnospiraceae bacterium]
MSLEDLCTLSYYKKVADIDSSKNVSLVQHTQNHRFYVRKILEIYNAEIYRWLQQSNYIYFPRVYECVEMENEMSVPCLTVIEEYIPGETYEDIFREQGPLSEEKAVELGIELCRALSTIHALNPPVIHRDVKPSNMIRQRDGHLCLIDFNAAKTYNSQKQTDTVVIGTDGFAAPEQYGYRQCVIQTDIYGIGASMNYLLTGRTAREQLYTGAPISAREQIPFPTSGQIPFSVSEQAPSMTWQRGQNLLSHIIEKATAFEPSGRYQNVQEMMEELERCLVLLRKNVDNATYKTITDMTNIPPEPANISPDNEETVSAKPFSEKSSSAKLSFIKSVFVKTAPEYPRPWQKYLPPGFRSLSFTHIIPAIFGYLLIFAIGSGTVVTDENGAAVTGMQLWMNRACVTALMLHAVCFLCNYLNIREKAPFMKQIRQKPVRLLLSAGYVVLIVFFWVFVSVFLEVLFFS